MLAGRQVAAWIHGCSWMRQSLCQPRSSQLSFLFICIISDESGWCTVVSLVLPSFVTSQHCKNEELNTLDNHVFQRLYGTYSRGIGMLHKTDLK